MEVKLIAMDLDGTALQEDHMTVSTRLRDALEKAHEKGLIIVPVTGRPYKLLPPFLQENPQWKNYGILCNGSQIRSLRTGMIHYSLTVQGKDLQALLELAERYEVPVEFSADSKIYLTQRDLEAQQGMPELAFHCREILSRNSVLVESLRPMCTDAHFSVEKVNLNGIPENLRGKIEKAVAALNVSGVWSGKHSMEITHRDATKGKALKRLCGMIDIPPEQVLALGDSENDLSMLQIAGMGVAMGNASELVKRAANAVTQSNMADGAAIAIERFAL